MSSSIVGRQEISTIKPRQKFEGHTDWVVGAIHLPDGQRIMTCSFDGSLRVWNLKSGKQIGDDWRSGDSAVGTIALSPDGKKVVSGSGDGGVKLWDINTGKVIAEWTGHKKAVSPSAGVEIVRKWRADPTTGLQGNGTWRRERQSSVQSRLGTNAFPESSTRQT
jgi:WD40 repeat protein